MRFSMFPYLDQRLFTAKSFLIITKIWRWKLPGAHKKFQLHLFINNLMTGNKFYLKVIRFQISGLSNFKVDKKDLQLKMLQTASGWKPRLNNLIVVRTSRSIHRKTILLVWIRLLQSSYTTSKYFCGGCNSSNPEFYKR